MTINGFMIQNLFLYQTSVAIFSKQASWAGRGRLPTAVCLSRLFLNRSIVNTSSTGCCMTCTIGIHNVWVNPGVSTLMQIKAWEQTGPPLALICFRPSRKQSSHVSLSLRHVRLHFLSSLCFSGFLMLKVATFERLNSEGSRACNICRFFHIINKNASLTWPFCRTWTHPTSVNGTKFFSAFKPIKAAGSRNTEPLAQGCH